MSLTTASLIRACRAWENHDATADELAAGLGIGRDYFYKAIAPFRKDRALTVDDPKTQRMLAEWREQCRKWAQKDRVRKILDTSRAA